MSSNTLTNKKQECVELRRKSLLLLLFLMTGIFAFSEEKGSTLELVLVKGGSYTMGSKSGDEKPMHNVTLDSFFIGKYEVTQKQYEAIMKYNPAKFIDENNPVEQTSWYDAIVFCNELSKMEGLEPYYEITVKEKQPNGNISNADVSVKGGKGYRLPTEAEWEYAARGGAESKGYKYSGSNAVTEVAWVFPGADGKTHNIGTKAPNELGIYDMSGNVLEYCQDWYGAAYYGASPEKAPSGPETGTEKVERGGCWSDNATSAKVTFRGYGMPLNSYSVLGFRIARTE